MSVKFPELDKIADWRNNTMYSLRSNNLTAKGDSQRKWVELMDDTEAYYFIYKEEEPFQPDLFIGYCGLDKIKPVERTAEISLLIGDEFKKQGYGKEAVDKLLSIAFEHMNLNLVYAEVIDIVGANKFWHKCGFRYEAKLRDRYFKWGSFRDCFVLSVSKQEYEESR
jgi:RimJ/RimL family protein N-acetyltransferase